SWLLRPGAMPPRRAGRRPPSDERMHRVGDLLRQGQGAAAILAGHGRVAALPHGGHEVLELAPQRLVALHVDAAPLDARRAGRRTEEPVELELLLGVVDGDVSVGLE